MTTNNGAIKTKTVAVASSFRAIYRREDPLANYIPCGFCTCYRAIDTSFLVFHMMELHQNDLTNAHIVSHSDIPAWYDLIQRAEFIVDLIQRRNLRAGWLAVRK